MKKLLYLIVLVFIFSCGDKEDDINTNCKFIGKWCTEDPFNAGQCWSLGVLKFEFKSNGELIQNGTTFFTWKSDDCKTINVFSKGTGSKVTTYEVVSVSDTRLTLDIGTIAEFVKEK